jgi:hypothetical protein
VPVCSQFGNVTERMPLDDIQRLDREISELQADITELRADVKQLLQIANIGQGVLWGLLKLGGMIVVIVGTAAWLWDKFGK